nr:uncharacterized protein LOC109179008 isoform X3 [Ipomoea batatas]
MKIIGDGYVVGEEKIQIIPEEGSSIEIDKHLAICKKCSGNITENNAKMAGCKPWHYLLHTHCEHDFNVCKGYKCPQCGNSAHYESVQLIPVQEPTEKEQSKWRKFLKVSNSPFAYSLKCFFYFYFNFLLRLNYFRSFYLVEFVDDRTYWDYPYV